MNKTLVDEHPIALIHFYFIIFVFKHASFNSYDQSTYIIIIIVIISNNIHTRCDIIHMHIEYSSTK